MNLTDKESEVLEQTAALVPAYNAGGHLQGVIDDIKQIMPAERIIVVDDGSADNTADIARAAGVILVVHDPNQGKGVALKSGVDKARELGFEFVIALDADGQHAPSEIPRFIRRQAETGADMIVGNRVDGSEVGMGGHDNEVVILDRLGGEEHVGRASKAEVATRIWESIARCREQLAR